MANNLESNTVEDLAQIFLEQFEAKRCVSKAVNTQLLEGRYTPRTGGEVSVKRPHDYRSVRTPKGDISGETSNDMIAGKATGVVQDYITVPIEWENIEEALELDQLEQILEPATTRAVTDMETSFADFARKNLGLSVGTPGTAVNDWKDVAYAGSLMDSLGVPMDEFYYLMNPFVATDLAGAQSGLNGSDELIRTAWQRAQISDNFGGMSVMSCNTLQPHYDTPSGATALADRAGVIASDPVVTYVAHKDTMVQTVAVSGLTADATIPAGSVVEITGRYYLNQRTRKSFIDNTGNQVQFRATVVEDTVLDGTGAGTISITGPGIWETDGQYNTTDSAIVSGDVITVLGAEGYTAQPNLFFHKQALGIATVKLPKLSSIDTIATTEDGISIRVSKYSDGDANTQKVRFDILPVHVAFNPFFGGLGYGQA